ESKLADDVVKMGVQVNGKLRGELSVAKTASKDDILKMAKELPNVLAFIEGKTIVKEICVPAKIVNIVVK
ncbi:MAG: hypothetical protein IJF70_08260, partial [Opitutales bacterium]|nr:hypothetical protein [Opitutales bacterium]